MVDQLAQVMQVLEQCMGYVYTKLHSHTLLKIEWRAGSGVSDKFIVHFSHPFSHVYKEPGGVIVGLRVHGKGVDHHFVFFKMCSENYKSMHIEI